MLFAVNSRLQRLASFWRPRWATRHKPSVQGSKPAGTRASLHAGRPSQAGAVLRQVRPESWQLGDTGKHLSPAGTNCPSESSGAAAFRASSRKKKCNRVKHRSVFADSQLLPGTTLFDIHSQASLLKVHIWLSGER